MVDPRRLSSVLLGLFLVVSPALGHVEEAPPAARVAPQALGVDDLRAPLKAKPAPVLLPSLRYELAMDQVGRVELPPLDHEALFAEDAASAADQRVVRYGKRRDLVVPLSAGSWSHVPPNVFHWAVDITSPGALGLRLRLNMELPARSFLVVYSPDDPTRVHGPYGGAGPFKTGQVWTPTTFGDTVRVEFLMAGDVPPVDGQAPFLIDRLQHVYRDPFAEGFGLDDPEGPCHNDVTCYGAWANTAKAVGGTGFIANDALWCTGQLITTQNGDLTPYFLTANHCIGNNSTAQNVEVYWLYQSSVCNGAPPALASVPQSAVTTLLATQPGIGTSDHTLLMIEGALPGGLHWVGWNAGAISNGTDVTGVHHPDGAYKRISFGDKIPISNANLVQVGWFDGPTEPGSSGSGLFLTSNQQLIGTLSTGSSACGATGSGWPDQYGAFSKAYPSLSALLTGGSDDGFENNDSCGAAAPFSDGTSSNLVVKADDDDWYSLTVPAGNQLNVSLGFTHAYGDIDMKLFNACGGSQLAISESATNNEALSWTNTTGGALTVRLQVYLYSDTRNDYSLTVSGTTGGGGGPDCPGTGDCCADNGTPGCADGSCCQAVCACDPFCCDTEWDEFCAGNGFQGSGCGAAVLCASCSAVPNDDCANALVVGDGSFAFDTTGATTDGPAEPGLCTSFSDTQVGSDIWYRYVASCTGDATLSLCASSYDTKLAVYAGAACPSSSAAIACNDDACGGGQNLQSRIVFPVVAGNSYLIRVGGYNGATGAGTLAISCEGGGGGCQPDLGFGGPGSATLTVCGDTSSGGTATFSLTGAPPNVSCWLVYSLNDTGVAFGGGTLVPFPTYFTIPFNTNGAGAVSFDINGGGGPLTLNCQFAIKASQSQWWLSNAVALGLEP